VDWEHWGFTLSLCHCTKSMLCGFDNVVWWFICQVMVVFVMYINSNVVSNADLF
jgi:hypothetical protein